VNEEHDRQVKQGILPFYFSKYEFTKTEQSEVDRLIDQHELPLETEISDEYMTFA